MKVRISQKKLEINKQKKNITGEACFLPFNGEAVKYSEALPSVARGVAQKKSEAIFSINSNSPNVLANSKHIEQKKYSLSEANSKDWQKIVFDHYKKNSLETKREFTKKEAIQRKILKSDFEKTEKEIRFKELKKINKTLTPLKPYYQIQTCMSNNSHFARVMVLCSCNDHINCGVCRLKRMIRLQKKYLPVISEFKNPKMLTLTMKRSGSLKNDLMRLNKCLSRFKKTKDWKNKVDYYFGSKEVVENNVHAHIVIDSKYWTQKEISELWFKITGTDYIVDIRKLKNPKKAIKEVFKYIVKDFKKDLLEEVSEFRKNNLHFRWVFGSKGLAELADFGEADCEAINEAEILSALEGADTSLDTIAISGRQTCPCCSSDLILVGDFETKEEAESESRRILAGNQYRRKFKT